MRSLRPGFRCRSPITITLWGMPEPKDYAPTGPAHYEDTLVRVDRFVVGPVENNVFIIRDKGSGEAILIDAANEHDLLVPLCKATGVRRVLTTHGHWDHIQAVTAVRDAGIDVGVAAEDAAELSGYDFIIHDGDICQVGALRLKAMHTPGHSPGSTSFILEGTRLLFTGDTLFPGGPGNTSFPDASFETIIDSIEGRIFTLPAETIVLPGHGLDTTVGAERPSIGDWVERGW